VFFRACELDSVFLDAETEREFLESGLDICFFHVSYKQYFANNSPSSV